MSELNTGTDHLLGRIEGHVAVLSFNRPEARNALSEEMYNGFAAALPQVRDNPDVRVLMVTGEGGAFCSGGDVKGFRARHESGGSSATPEHALDQLRRIQASVSLAIRRLNKPVVAAIPGPAAGAGLSIALSADLRVAAERSIFVSAFSTIGASGDFGSSWFLPRLLGEAKAKEFMFFSERVSASEALDLGLVNAVLPDDGFDTGALDYCHRLAGRSPIALRFIKENIHRSFDVGLAEGLDAEATAMVRAMATADHREAVAAFFDKRTPDYQGR
ncbi:MAG: enoyl-CoA hydratase-related protein [Actinomycetota bacterium]|jgi:2-(1,2-epoxy-1,2-dihydrophenyl)acetyl-CoA isomerase|nr:enoyl-CoA hydratase-related protein [Actinomycetota bacterium]MDA3014801.1 enoyl-CoA hydratase-related protein [Actinomycetota bacterium]MDA3028848.1 enoyl-CoA hydratase-related protein [Actinomycetota bacterium]